MPMKNEIKQNIDNSAQLEKLYRGDKKSFEKDFFAIYPEISTFPMAGFWKTRLEFETIKEGSESKIRKAEILFLLIICAILGFLIKIPQIFNISLNDYSFYEKNAGLIVFLGLSFYVFMTQRLIHRKQIFISLVIFIISAVYVNLLPPDNESHSITLVYIHLPLMFWCLYGMVFINFDLNNLSKRIDFIKHNGDLAILGAVILICGGILTGVTLGLFSAIDMSVEKFYFDYVIIIGLVSAPVVAAFIIRNYPLVTTKIPSIIANIFSPLVLITLIIYLISIIVTGKDPYNNRDFLIVFNFMLLGVMAIIIFSVSEISTNKKQRFTSIMLFALTIITLIINLVALSAILYRLGEYGFTPNRTAVLGSNILIFGNLVLIMVDLYKTNFMGHAIKMLEITIAKYLPVYAVWTAFVVFVIPLIFGFK
jgi:hypothetical protein